MAQPLTFVLSVPETPEDHGPEPSPYDESEVHDSFYQLIQEQSQWVAEEGLELQQREPGPLETPGSGHQTLLGPEDPLVHSTATLRILASMPSRTIGRSRGAIISQYYNRTVRLRRRVSRPELRGVGRSARPSLRLYDLELDPVALEEEEKRFLLVKELQGLPVAQRDHMLRGMPLGLAEKRCLREESRTLTRKRRGRRGRPLASVSLVTSVPGSAPPSMSHSFGESYRVGSTAGVHAVTVFCSWDHKVTQKRASRVQHDNIRTHLKELLAEWQLRQVPQSLCGRLRQVAVLGLVWLLCLGTALGCTVAVYAFSELTIKSPVSTEQEGALLALPTVVCVLNLGAPYLYRCLAALERHDSPVLEVYVAICRNLILKMVILGILCYHWLGRRVGVLKEQCWENFVGQELYRLMVLDFIFVLLDTLFGELVWRLISEKKLKREKPEFDIAGNVLELIYGQTLTWLGVLFSPLLPAIQIIKLLCLFYVKKTSLMANCQAPRRPWLASHMSTVFVSLLCFPSFLGAAVFLCYAVWQVRPSSTCGPFRTLDTMYEAGKVWVRRLEQAGPSVSWVPWIHRYLVENTFPVYLVSALLLAVIYLNIQVVKGQRRVMCLLKEQISNEGEDKIFLINKLHSVYERKERRAGRTQEAERLAGDPDAW
ncbi:transmembrane channel-like protein 6 [Vulpes lagopus]|uniref:transmembrane channel-like protein 6 n=1 Tax=Vulpes lagopus TaxID=494514 RepID=UPI001BCA2A59|nr:transmembrane channel-like protein 6 [Vulpes lagopus]